MAAVNKKTMNWLMVQEDNNSICIWGWMRVRYEVGAKLDTLKRLYRDNISSLKFKANRSLVGFIE